ncbi:hypothetical protein [Anaerococcus nagyae]|uniref:hypothetical protein n=1 Tax=Anaerococcus nagyae TaxID=1755241 RepID=UPI0032461B0F
MAFRRKARKTINLEFVTADEQTLVYEVEHNQALADKLVTLGESVEDKEMTDSEEKAFLVKAYDEIMGQGAMSEIKEKVFENEELLLTDLLDIGFYIIEEVEKANKELAEEYQTLPKANPNLGQNAQASVQAPAQTLKPYINTPNDKTFTLEEVQRLLNEDKNKLSH